MIVISSHDASIIRTALILYPDALPGAVNEDGPKSFERPSTDAEIDLLIEDLRRFSKDPVGISDGAEYADLTYDVAVAYHAQIEQEAIAMTRPCRDALRSPQADELDPWIVSLLEEGSRRLGILEKMTRGQRQKAIEYDPSSIMDTVEF
ncbi:MAG: hypothetical protein CL472_08185 [Acidobacteria bacterium]|nr:hypothetical protein [Acidobacteriota bacterium]|tara:strand:+ start:270 stop:716 length:447 start_codon:yes stop_codon:yes gene_type:complete